MKFEIALKLYEKFLKKNKLYQAKNKILYELTIEKQKNWTKNKFKNKFSWYKEIKRKNNSQIFFKDLDKLDGWDFKNNFKELHHISNEFFSIIGVSTKKAGREINSWDQPFVKQKNLVGGIIGLVRMKLNNVPHYLIEAKFEPGNYNLIQLSPSVQATYSNLDRIHKGKKNKVLNYYFKKNYSTIRKNLVTEDGGRFYKKRNLHWIINTNKKSIKLSKNFKWLSMWEINQFIKKGSYVSPHLRSIISLI